MKLDEQRLKEIEARAEAFNEGRQISNPLAYQIVADVPYLLAELRKAREFGRRAFLGLGTIDHDEVYCELEPIAPDWARPG